MTGYVKMAIVEGGIRPERKTSGAACFDCCARLSSDETIQPGERKRIPLGFRLELPEHLEAVIRPRSGLSASGVDCTVGTIDSDYRGEVCAVLVNNTEKEFTVRNCERICLLAVREIPEVEIDIVDELSETARGSGGFGSTGM